MATIGQALTSPESGWRRYNDTDTNISYIGSWTVNSSQPLSYNGGHRYTASAENTFVKFNFVGSQLRYIGYKNTVEGKFKVKIDGVYVSDLVSNLGSPLTFQILLFEVSGLEFKEHRVEIEGVSGQVPLDAIDVDLVGELKAYDATVNQFKIICNDNITIYPNVYVDKDNVVKFNARYPSEKTTVTDTTVITQSTLEGGLLFETEFLDITKYSNITGIVMK